MNNFDQVFAEMKRHNMPLPSSRTHIRIPQARQLMQEAMRYVLNKENRELQWLPEYNEVVEWLNDNKGKGLLLYGNHGRGKSLLCRYILPALLLRNCQKVTSIFDTQQMNNRLDEALSKHIICIDDIGTEEVINNFGNRRHAFSEIMDAVEKQNKLIIISSNLNLEGLRSVYGERTVERIKSMTKRIVCAGESLRQ